MQRRYPEPPVPNPRFINWVDLERKVIRGTIRDEWGNTAGATGGGGGFGRPRHGAGLAPNRQSEFDSDSFGSDAELSPSEEGRLKRAEAPKPVAYVDEEFSLHPFEVRTLPRTDATDAMHHLFAAHEIAFADPQHELEVVASRSPSPTRHRSRSPNPGPVTGTHGGEGALGEYVLPPSPEVAQPLEAEDGADGPGASVSPRDAPAHLEEVEDSPWSIVPHGSRNQQPKSDREQEGVATPHPTPTRPPPPVPAASPNGQQGQSPLPAPPPPLDGPRLEYTPPVTRGALSLLNYSGARHHHREWRGGERTGGPQTHTSPPQQFGGYGSQGPFYHDSPPTPTPEGDALFAVSPHQGPYQHPRPGRMPSVSSDATTTFSGRAYASPQYHEATAADDRHVGVGARSDEAERVVMRWVKCTGSPLGARARPEAQRSPYHPGDPLSSTPRDEFDSPSPDRQETVSMGILRSHIVAPS